MNAPDVPLSRLSCRFGRAFVSRRLHTDLIRQEDAPLMYTLHYSPDSASLIVRLILQELELPHDCRLIDREAGELDSPAYRAMQPLGLIPALQTPDGPMFETGAMLMYLCERHHALAPAPGHPDRADYLSWFVFINNSIHTTLMQMFYPERVAGADSAATVVAQATTRMRGFLKLLDQMAATKSPTWLSADQPSALGYYVGVLIRWLATYGPQHAFYIRSSEYPALHRVLAALETRPAALACAKAEGLGPTIFTNPVY
ncbi:MAG: glutathione S-transferase family protein [Paracoccaceae bacterium]